MSTDSNPYYIIDSNLHRKLTEFISLSEAMTKEFCPHLTSNVIALKQCFRNDIEYFEGTHNKPSTRKLKY